MAESQSRYGIMEELNNRKINQKEKLANIERETDNHVFEEEKKGTELDEEIKDREKRYKVEFKQRQQDMKVNLQIVTQDFERAMKTLGENMKDDSDNYEQRFQEWKNIKQEEIALLKSGLKRYQEVQKKKIEEKKEVITEIENGIASLKEMSAEQKEVK